MVEDGALGAGQRQPELGAATGASPGLQPALVQPGVLKRDGQTKTAAADDPVSRRVGPPEASEDLLGLRRREPDTVIAHSHRDGLGVPGDGDVDGPVFTVTECVAEQVPDDPLDAPRVGLDQHRALVVDADLGAKAAGDRLLGGHLGLDQRDQVDFVGCEHRRPGVEAGDLE